MQRKQKKAKEAFKTGDVQQSISIHNAKIDEAKEKHKK